MLTAISAGVSAKNIQAYGSSYLLFRKIIYSAKALANQYTESARDNPKNRL